MQWSAMSASDSDVRDSVPPDEGSSGELKPS